MIKKISLLTVVSLLWVGCASKKCGPNDYKGFTNAILCDYAGMEKARKEELAHKKLERNKLFHEFQMLIAMVTGKKEELNSLQEQVVAIENELSEVNVLLSKVNSSKVNANNIKKLKKSLQKMNRSILSKSTFFDVKDATYTNLKLIEDSDSLQYAKAYNNERLHGTKFAKAYKDDIDSSIKIKVALSTKLKKLSDAIDDENILTKKNLLVELMNDVEEYKNSIKSTS